jgi:aspartate-semialdehyde dehydrogenase
MVTSLQALSGAGYPGVASLDGVGNVVPFIRGEEPKLEAETRRMLGRLVDGRVVPADFAISAACNRVPVVDGHSESVSVELEGDPTPEALREVLATWRPQQLGLPSAPVVPIRLHEEQDRPQPRLDVERDRGMSVHVGRVRPCGVLGIKFSLLGHNLERGAAGGSVLNAELARSTGRVGIPR